MDPTKLGDMLADLKNNALKVLAQLTLLILFQNVVKPYSKVDYWNCGGNHFASACNKPAKKDGDKKGKVNVTFSDVYNEDYGDGVIPTCFKHSLPEYLEN